MDNIITSVIIDDEQDARDGPEVLLKICLPEVEVLAKAIARYKNQKEKESLKIKIEKLYACLQPGQLKFSTQKGFILLDPEEIIYCQAEGNYTELFSD